MSFGLAGMDPTDIASHGGEVGPMPDCQRGIHTAMSSRGEFQLDMVQIHTGSLRT